MTPALSLRTATDRLPVLSEEREAVLERFNSGAIFAGFWARVLEAM
jgi:hypothetical protein